jgi:hypothetical protein
VSLEPAHKPTECKTNECSTEQAEDLGQKILAVRVHALGGDFGHAAASHGQALNLPGVVA